jgi:membrane protein DedA with SNARE-associated domain
LTSFITHHGLPLMFAVVMVESFGIPLPGESALIAQTRQTASGTTVVTTTIEGRP